MLIATSPALRAGLRLIMEAESSLEVIAEVSSLEDSLASIESADVLVVAGSQHWHSANPEILSEIFENNAVLLLVEEKDDLPSEFNGLKINTWGALSLDSTVEEIVAAVRALKEGLLVGAPGLVKLGWSSRGDVGIEDKVLFDRSLVEPLTNRESEVLQLLAQGLANKQIALVLGISEHTVKFHISSLYSKLGVTSRTEAVRDGLQRGLITL
jgi:NarL family two-component system response regulator YdfI